MTIFKSVSCDDVRHRPFKKMTGHPRGRSPAPRTRQVAPDGPGSHTPTKGSPRPLRSPSPARQVANVTWKGVCWIVWGLFQTSWICVFFLWEFLHNCNGTAVGYDSCWDRIAYVWSEIARHVEGERRYEDLLRRLRRKINQILDD